MGVLGLRFHKEIKFGVQVAVLGALLGAHISWAQVSFPSQTNLHGDIYSTVVNSGGVLPAGDAGYDNAKYSDANGVGTIQTYTYTFTAATSGYLQLYFRNDPSYFNLFNVSLTTNGGSNLITNPNFSGASTKGANNIDVPAGWMTIGTQGLGAAGTVSRDCRTPTGVTSCWRDGAIGGFDGIAQRVITAGNTYTLRLLLSGYLDDNKKATSYLPYEDFIEELLIATGNLPDGMVITGDQSNNLLMSLQKINDTQLSLQNTANYLQGIYASQNAAMVNNLSYDCNIFDKHKICLSTGGRYSYVNAGSVNTFNAFLIGAYRVRDNLRIGAWLDQNLASNTHNGIQLSNGLPMFGIFGVWNQNKSGMGWEARVAAGYGNRDITVTREVIGTSDAGSGSTSLNTHGVSAVLSYNLPVSSNWTASPYAGVLYTKTRMGGYTEAASSSVTSPLTYSDLTQESYTALAGVKMVGQITPKFGVSASVGVEQDFHNKGNTYSVTGMYGLTDVNFNPTMQKTRASVSAGAWYAIDKNRRVSFSTTYKGEAFKSSNSLSAMLTYTVGF